MRKLDEEIFSADSSYPKAPFYRRMMEMQCRKDIIAENKHINDKGLAAVTSFRTRFSTGIKKNKFRLYYFVGFCVVFNLERVYDYVLYRNSIYSRIKHFLTPRLYPATIREQRGQKFSLNQHNRQMAEIFIKIDQGNRQIDPDLMNRLSGKDKIYDKHYVDIKQFTNFFADQQIDQLRMKIGAVYGHRMMSQLGL